LYLNYWGVYMMYFDFLQDHIMSYSNEKFNWNNATDKFICFIKLTSQDIDAAEQRLETTGYQFPTELKNFWYEMGCGYLCSNFLADNVFEDPKALLDIYFSEGEWSKLKTTLNFYEANEFPFLRTTNFNYITIGLEAGNNLGKIYLNGIEIAGSLSEFIQHLLNNPIFYQTLLLAS